MSRIFKRPFSGDIKDISNFLINESFDITFGEKCFYRPESGNLKADESKENKENMNTQNSRLRDNSLKQLPNEASVRKVHLIPLRGSNSNSRRDSLNISVSPNNNNNNNTSRSPTEISNKIQIVYKQGLTSKDKPPANPYINFSTSSIGGQKNESKARSSVNGGKKENIRLIKQNNFLTNTLNFNETINLSLDQNNSNRNESNSKPRAKRGSYNLSNNEGIFSTLDNRKPSDSLISSPERRARKDSFFEPDDEEFVKKAEEVPSPIWMVQGIDNEFIERKKDEQQRVLLKSFSFKKEMDICVEELDKPAGTRCFEKIEDFDQNEYTIKGQQGSSKSRKMKLPANQFWQNFFQNVKRKTLVKKPELQTESSVSEKPQIKKPLARARNNSFVGNREINFFQERRGQVYEQESIQENKRNCISHLDGEWSQNEESINEILNVSDICGSNRNHFDKANLSQEKKVISLHQRKYSLNATRTTMQRRKSSTHELNLRKLKLKNYELGFNKIRRLFTRKTSYFFFVNLLKTYYSRGARKLK